MDFNNDIYNLLRYYGKLQPEDTFYRPLHYVLTHLNAIATIPIYDLADASFVSPATISRMCRELGYKNYQELKISVYSAYRRANDAEQANLVFRLPRDDAKSPESAMLLNYLDQCRAGLDFSERFVRSDAFEQHLQLMRSVDNIFVFSTTYQEVIPLQNKLILRGKYLDLYYGSVQEIEARSRADLEHVDNFCAIILLRSREEYVAFEPLAHFMKDKGASIIMLRPQSVQHDERIPEPDLMISFPDVGSLSDETFFSSYFACLTITF